MDWDGVKTLGQLTRSGTVRACAKALKVSHSTVSRRIEALEAAAGARLVLRTPEGYVLTDAGEHLAASAIAMEEEITRARRLISGDDRDLAGRICVTMAEPVATHAIGPRLPEFIARYPNLEVEITSTYSLVDLSRRKADVAIRMHNNPPDSLFGKRLFAYNNAPYASPAYLAAHDLMHAPEEARWIGWDGTFERHPSWTANTGLARVPVWGDFPALDLQTAMAVAGVGVAFLPCFIGDQTPGLVRAGDAPPSPARDIWILTHADLRRTSRVRAFMAFAEEVLVDNKALFLGESKC